MLQSTTPTTSHLVYRQKSASPIRVARYSQYKFPKQSSTSSQLLGHSHAHLEPLPSVYKLPVVSGELNTQGAEDSFGTRHVSLGFELLHNGEPRTPSKEQFDAIFNLFPTAYRVSFAPPFLVVVCKILPPQPWPVTVAGMPLFLTDDEKVEPMEIGLYGHGPKVTTKSPINGWQTPNLSAFKEVFEMLDQFSKDFRRLQWTGASFVAIASQEPFANWRKRLPCMVNSRLIGYIFDEKPLMEKAVRIMVSQGRTADDSVYNQLITTRHYDCVHGWSVSRAHDIGHGFSGGVGDEVLHPNRNGSCIADVSKVFGETGIALAELRSQSHLAYSRTTFPTPQAAVQPFRNLLSLQEIRVHDLIYMDTAVNGRCEGSVVKLEILRLPSDELGSKDVQYVIGSFVYFGNGTDILLDGCCGASLWNDDHDVIGKFQYLDASPAALCYCPSFAGLKDFGYTIAPTTIL
ncbi:MAG: hypothetical protein Q9191_008347 [Dirinaria sp. TL-2023a]